VCSSDLLNSAEVNRTGNKSPTGNSLRGVVELHVDARLASPEWVLLASPEDTAIAVGFLGGREQPTVEMSNTDFNTLGMSWRGFIDYGVALVEHRAAVWSAGA